jgi:hypothetical protein
MIMTERCAGVVELSLRAACADSEPTSITARAISGVASTAFWYISSAALSFPEAANCRARSLCEARALHGDRAGHGVSGPC